MKKLIPPSKCSTLICIDYPHQLLPALAALHHYHLIRNEPLPKGLLLFMKYHQGSKINSNEIGLITKTLADFPESQLLIAKKWMCKSLIPVKLRAFFLAYNLGAFIKNIFFAHDVSSDFTAQVLMQAFPKAERICYGDSLGLVYSHSYFEKLMYQSQEEQHFSLSNFTSKLKRKFILPKSSKRYTADLAILALPCDPGKDFLDSCRLEIPSKKLMLETITQINQNLPGFSSYIKSLISEEKSPLVFLATSNLAESKLMSRENEVALYLDIIKNSVKPPATILIKPHPGADQSTIHLLKQALGENYKLLTFNENYTLLPIELAETLIKNSQILSISYSSISIPYLYDRPVKHALTEELIRRYAYPEKQNWLSINNDLYLKMISALKTWKGDAPMDLEKHHEP